MLNTKYETEIIKMISRLAIEKAVLLLLIRVYILYGFGCDNTIAIIIKIKFDFSRYKKCMFANGSLLSMNISPR